MAGRRKRSLSRRVRDVEVDGGRLNERVRGQNYLRDRKLRRG